MHALLATAGSDDISGGAAVGILVAILAVWIIGIVGVWKMFEKAGEAGWQSIIPIWGTMVMLRIVGRPLWWVVLLLIPCVGLILWIVVAADLAKSFGKGGGVTVGLVLLPMIFLCILGFGDARYVGPAANPAANPAV